jgi:hypothetical protein
LELNQLSLFEDNNNILAPRADKLVMNQDALQQWKKRVFQYQQQVRHNQQPQQASLFDLATVHCDLDNIDPFTLKLQPSQFYRLPEQSNQVCIYFVIDNALPILLYVGETKQSPKQRWDETHNCKQYISQYYRTASSL